MKMNIIFVNEYLQPCNSKANIMKSLVTCMNLQGEEAIYRCILHMGDRQAFFPTALRKL